MRYQIFTEEVQDSYDIAILIKPTSFDADSLRKYYVDIFNQHGITEDKIIAYTLQYNGGKVSTKDAKEYLKELIPVLQDIGIKYVYCADAQYFKLLSAQPRAEEHLGYKFPIKDTDMLVTYGINHSSIKYEPSNLDKLKLSIQTVKDIIDENFHELGSTIIHSSSYPSNLADIRSALNTLHSYPIISCDIESYSLDFDKAKIGTIAFATDKHNGIAFGVDYSTNHTPNTPVRELLKEFFNSYKGTLIFHNAGYDTKVLIYELFMNDLLDNENLLRGIDTIATRLEDTQIIAYLATNSAHKPPLNLKYLAHEFTGNYAQDDIKDIKKIPLPILLKYNLIDCLATWFVYNKFLPEVISSNQETLYRGLMLDSYRLLLQTELTGMPISPAKVKEAKLALQKVVDNSFDIFNQFQEILETEENIRQKELKLANSKLKKKVHTIDMPRYQNIKFNPNSPLHLQELLFNVLNLPVLSLTDTKQPSTGGEVIQNLLNHCLDKDKPLINALVNYKGVDKILGTFIPAFEKAIDKGHSVSYLHGSFKIGGTVSGRLSSANPNLQNLPSGSTHGKLIKECFVAPDGYIFCGADFASLEDRINALLTKDTNKLKVYTDGYDGHSLRAYNYWTPKMPDIDGNSVESINSIKTLYEEIRNKSKEPTFLLTYGGSWVGLMKNCGFSEEEAKAIEENYHELYKESDEWKADKIQEACNNGYVTLAFGLRLLTPLLHKSILGNSSTLYQAESEARTAANAFSGQSYGLLNNRAAVAFMKRAWASKWRNDIKPVALIHDAIYLLIKDDIECLEWVNNTLIEEMEWQGLPELQHDQVNLTANLDVFYPSWASPIELPNKASQAKLQQTIDNR